MVVEPPTEGPEYIGSIDDLSYKGGSCKMWCWNCDGIRSVMRNGKFEKFVEVAKPTIICLNETKVDELSMELYGVKRELAFLGFPPDLQFWNASKRMRGYSGVGVLISKDFVGGAPEKVEYDGFGEPGLHDAEGRTLTLHFKHFLLVVTYVPNAGVWRSEQRLTPGCSILGLERLEYRVE